MKPIRVAIAASLLIATGRAAAQPAREEAARRPSPLPVAVGGYCPVILRDRQQWQPGDPAVAAAFDGAQYLFASERERAIFAAAPASYAPVLGGDCPVVFAQRGERVAGRLEYALLRGGRLMFVSSDDARQRYLDDPASFRDVDIAFGGRCPVTRVEARRDVPGIAEAAVLHGGLRYLLASAPERALFLQNPAKYDGSGGGRSMATAGPATAKGAPSTPGAASPWRLQDLAAMGDAIDRDAHGSEQMLAALPAMSGYCPVTIQRDGLWVRGRHDNRVELDGQTWLLAGPDEKALFAADPATFLPACGGDCVVTLATTQERTGGSVFHALQYHGRLYLFADAERRAQFKADPARFADYDVANAGACVVTQVDDGRNARGLPQFAVWHSGRLYRFAGAVQRERFLADPERYAVAAGAGPRPASQSAVAQEPPRA
ncbi:MAG: hypothetical protein IT424_14675 [Pirellulales bacterium]|nr:hypothetical protein [Pirellulales bacterium]